MTMLFLTQYDEVSIQPIKLINNTLFSFDGSDTTHYRASVSCSSLACLCTAGGHTHTQHIMTYCSRWELVLQAHKNYCRPACSLHCRQLWRDGGMNGWMDGSAHRFTTLPAAAAIGKINTDVLYTSVTCST